MRRLYHLIGGLSLVLIVAHAERKTGLILIYSLFFIAVIMDVIRLLLPGLNRIFCRYLSPLLRQEEEGRPTGSAYYLAGVLISLLLFKREIALFSMTILAVGDPAASTIGKGLGRNHIWGKSIEGSMAFFFASIGAGFLLHKLWPELPVLIMIAGVMAGTLAELISNKMNDNLLIPLVASGAMGTVSFLLNLVNLD